MNDEWTPFRFLPSELETSPINVKPEDRPGGKEPEGGGLDEARAVVREAIAAVKDDPGAPFVPDVIAALILLQDRANADFHRAMARFKEAGVAKTDLHAEIGKRLVAEATRKPAQGSAVVFEEVEPWPYPVNGAELLDDMRDLLKGYSILPDHAAPASALWSVAAWAFDAFDVFPRLLITSPEMQCGKTRTLGLISRAIPRSLSASNITAAALFRSIEKWKPSLLIDEADTFLKENEELRGVVNSGHCRTGQVIRCVGDSAEPAAFSTWAPLAIAMIGSPAGTILDRSIIVQMRRRAPKESMKRIRRKEIEPVFRDWRRRAARWAADNMAALREAEPAVPNGLGDREADNWEPLLAVADIAGGTWPDIARAAASALSGIRQDADVSLGVELLRDLRDIFGDQDKMATEDILSALHALKERPWKEYGKEGKTKPLSDKQLAGLLKRYGVRSATLKFCGVNAKGYARRDDKGSETALEDAFSRYLHFCRSGVAEDDFPGNHSENPPRQGSYATEAENGSVAGFSREKQHRYAATDKTPLPGGSEENEAVQEAREYRERRAARAIRQEGADPGAPAVGIPINPSGTGEEGRL